MAASGCTRKQSSSEADVDVVLLMSHIHVTESLAQREVCSHAVQGSIKLAMIHLDS